MAANIIGINDGFFVSGLVQEPSCQVPPTGPAAAKPEQTESPRAKGEGQQTIPGVTSTAGLPNTPIVDNDSHPQHLQLTAGEREEGVPERRGRPHLQIERQPDPAGQQQLQRDHHAKPPNHPQQRARLPVPARGRLQRLQLARERAQHLAPLLLPPEPQQLQLRVLLPDGLLQPERPKPDPDTQPRARERVVPDGGLLGHGHVGGLRPPELQPQTSHASLRLQSGLHESNGLVPCG